MCQWKMSLFLCQTCMNLHSGCVHKNISLNTQTLELRAECMTMHVSVEDEFVFMSNLHESTLWLCT